MYQSRSILFSMLRAGVGTLALSDRAHALRRHGDNSIPTADSMAGCGALFLGPRPFLPACAQDALTEPSKDGKVQYVCAKVDNGSLVPPSQVQQWSGDGVSASDVQQGGISDCVGLAEMASMAVQAGIDLSTPAARPENISTSTGVRSTLRGVSVFDSSLRDSSPLSSNLTLRALHSSAASSRQLPVRGKLAVTASRSSVSTTSPVNGKERIRNLDPERAQDLVQQVAEVVQRDTHIAFAPPQVQFVNASLSQLTRARLRLLHRTCSYDLADEQLRIAANATPFGNFDTLRCELYHELTYAALQARHPKVMSWHSAVARRMGPELDGSLVDRIVGLGRYESLNDYLYVQDIAPLVFARVRLLTEHARDTEYTSAMGASPWLSRDHKEVLTKKGIGMIREAEAKGKDFDTELDEAYQNAAKQIRMWGGPW